MESRQSTRPSITSDVIGTPIQTRTPVVDDDSEDLQELDSTPSNLGKRSLSVNQRNTKTKQPFQDLSTILNNEVEFKRQKMQYEVLQAAKKEEREQLEANARIQLINSQRETAAIELNQKQLDYKVSLLGNRKLLKEEGHSAEEIDKLFPL